MKVCWGEVIMNQGHINIVPSLAPVARFKISHSLCAVNSEVITNSALEHQSLHRGRLIPLFYSILFTFPAFFKSSSRDFGNGVQ